MIIAGIAYVKEDEGCGQYLRLYMGISLLEKTIFVDEKDALKALELIKSIKSQNLIDDNLETNGDSNESYSSQTKLKRNTNKIILAIMVSMFVIPFLLMLIFFMIELFH